MTRLAAAAALAALVWPLAGATAPEAAAVSPAAQRLAVARLLGRGLPVYCGGRRGRYVALTFDDGPGPRTEAVLRLLARAGQRATFFLVGRRLASFPSLPRRELALGALGDHTWSHPPLTALPRAAVARELAKTKAAIERLTASRISLFRPPYGFHDRAVDAEARRLSLLEVLWSIDSHDSYPHGGLAAPAVGAHVARYVRPGAIVLLHENRGQTDVALRRWIIPALQRRGLRSVSVPELLALDPPTDAQLQRGIYGCPDGARAA